MLSYVDLVGPELGGLTARQTPAPFACLCVRGPDAVAFVHRLCAQDVEGMAAGEARPAAFLSAKGKLETLTWVGRLPDALWLEAQAPQIDKLAQLLDRYHFSERLVIGRGDLLHAEQVVGPNSWQTTSMRGPGIVATGDAIALAGESRGLRWVRWHRRTAAAEAPRGAILDESTWQLLRVAAGLPWVGIDCDATHLGLELDIDDHVSLTKGCYTGQEIVARIHTYGHTNRRLCRLRWSPSAAVAAGSRLTDTDGEDVGRVTSAVRLPHDAGGLGLTILPHALATVGSSLAVAGTDYAVEVC